MKVEKYVMVDTPKVPYRDRRESITLPEWWDDKRTGFIPGTQGKEIIITNPFTLDLNAEAHNFIIFIDCFDYFTFLTIFNGSSGKASGIQGK